MGKDQFLEPQPELSAQCQKPDATVRWEIEVGAGPDQPVMLDVGSLLKTRMLVQAGSGGGKSWLLRRLLEQTFPLVRHIVFDPEGELVTLAERFDYTVCSVDSQVAPLTSGGGAEAARLIFSSGRSTILVLSEFDLEELREFVGDFCTELLRMPQEQWHHMLVVFDEAQLVAPEKEKAASKKPLIDLARRGRKRGICPVCATQRLSELSKGVAGMLENLLIGLTTLDLDIARAAEMLGLKYADARAQLPLLGGGRFLSYGPSLGYRQTEVKVGPVTTRHAVLGDFAGVAHKPTMTAAELQAQLKAAADARVVQGDTGAAPSFPGTRQTHNDRVGPGLCGASGAKGGDRPKGWPFCENAAMPRRSATKRKGTTGQNAATDGRRR